MLLWRMCRLFMRLRETAMGAAATQDPNAPVTGMNPSESTRHVDDDSDVFALNAYLYPF